VILPAVVRAASRPPPASALAETAVLVALVSLLNVVVYPGSPGFHGWAVNPYVVPVLLAGCRYGLFIGLAAAAAASAAHLAMLLALTTGLGGAGFLTSAHLGTPLLLGLAGVICGHFADHRRAQLAIAVAALDRSVLHRERLSGQFTLLSDEKHLLDKQVLSGDDIFSVLARIGERTARLPPGRFPARILSVATRLMGGGSTALYGIVKPAGGASEVGVLVRATDESWPRGLSSADPVFRAALATTSAVSLPQLRGFAEAATFAGSPVHVACGLAAMWSRRRLVLVMRDVPFSAFSAARRRSLTAAMRALARSLTRAQRLGALESDRALATLERTAARAVFRARLDAEIAVAERAGTTIKVLKCRIRPHPAGTPAGVRLLKRALRRVVAPLVAAGELVLHTGGGALFTVLCPVGSSQSAAEVARRLTEEAATLAQKDPSAPPPDALELTVLDLGPEGGPDAG